jgi:hypothetical protein
MIAIKRTSGEEGLKGRWSNWSVKVQRRKKRQVAQSGRGRRANSIESPEAGVDDWIEYMALGWGRRATISSSRRSWVAVLGRARPGQLEHWTHTRVAAQFAPCQAYLRRPITTHGHGHYIFLVCVCCFPSRSIFQWTWTVEDLVPLNEDKFLTFFLTTFFYGAVILRVLTNMIFSARNSFSDL